MKTNGVFPEVLWPYGYSASDAGDRNSSNVTVGNDGDEVGSIAHPIDQYILDAIL